jgi:glycerol-3-phosphate acyltransferase PlsY
LYEIFIRPVKGMAQMQVLLPLVVLLCGYLLGSIPFGLIIVQLFSGQDIRQVASGRTGGTNAFRAAGTWAGIATGFFDLLKGAVAAWLALWFFPDNAWLHVLAPVAAIMGHNYSIFLIERKENGKWHFRGGAGGAPCAGGAFGLWPPSLLFIFPIGLMVFYFVGYASVTTLSIGFVTTMVFICRAILGLSPWEYVVYGILSELLLILALRPNIERLLKGNERLVGLRAKRARKREARLHSSSSNSSSSSS